MDFKVELVSHVMHGDDSLGFERHIVLPFVPFVGLELLSPMTTTALDTVERVTWIEAEQCFMAWCAEHHLPSHFFGPGKERYIKFYESLGWKLVSLNGEDVAEEKKE